MSRQTGEAPITPFLITKERQSLESFSSGTNEPLSEIKFQSSTCITSTCIVFKHVDLVSCIIKLGINNNQLYVGKHCFHCKQ